MDRQELLDFLKDTNGRFFSVHFFKKNGEPRMMNTRIGVTSGVKGVGMSWDPLAKGYLPLMDIVKGEFRMVNLDTTYKVVFNGEHDVEGEPIGNWRELYPEAV